MAKFVGVLPKSKADPVDRPLQMLADGTKCVMVAVTIPMSVYERLASLAVEECATVESHIDEALVQWVDEDLIAERGARAIAARECSGKPEPLFVPDPAASRDRAPGAC